MTSRKHAIGSAVWLSLSVAISDPAKAQQPDPGQQVMDSITNSAIKVCNVVETSGWSKSAGVTTEIKVQLSGLSRLMASLGFGVAGDDRVNSWVGPAQDKIADMAHMISDCRIKMVIQFTEFRKSVQPTQVAVSNAPNPAPALTPPPSTPAATSPKGSTHVVCHGELLERCKAHPFDVHEVCSNANGVGGANPNVTGLKICGNNNFSLRQTAESTDGNHCGYSWFSVTCN